MSPFVGDDALEQLVDAHTKITHRTGRRIADAGTDRLERNVKRRTPIDTNPFRHRPERPRGSLKRSVHRLVGVRFRSVGGRDRWEGEVVTYDPIVRYVEFDTPPHVIRPKVPGGRLHFQSRDGWMDPDGTYHPPGTWVSVEEVHHPGTTGYHMFALGALHTEAEIAEYAGPELARWKREVESVHV